MSTNCIRCVKAERTGNDLLCDACRVRAEPLDLAAYEGHTPEPWFLRYCDDDSNMNMLVISSKDYGDKHCGDFDDEPDTLAIVLHQLRPMSGHADGHKGRWEENGKLMVDAPKLLRHLRAAMPLLDLLVDLDKRYQLRVMQDGGRLEDALLALHEYRKATGR